MHPEAFLAITSAIALATSAFAVREKYTSIEVRAGALRQNASAEDQRATLEKRVREAVAEASRLRGLSLAGDALSSAPVYVERVAPRDAEELAKLVRGLALVDDVVLADVLGLPMARELAPTSPGLAALAPPTLAFAATLGASGLRALQLDFETFSAVHVSARPLAGRALGLVLLVRSTSRPVSTLLVDSVAHAAMRDGVSRSPSPLSTATSAWTSTDRSDAGAPVAVAALIERALREEHRALVLVSDGRITHTSAREGPGASVRHAAAEAADRLAQNAARALRVPAIARVLITLDDGRTLAWSALSAGSADALVSFTEAGAGSRARLDRLVGSFKRHSEARPSLSRSEHGEP